MTVAARLQRTPRGPRKHLYRGDPLAAAPSPELATILERHRGRPDALITVLEEIQDHYGYLPERDLVSTARALGFPLSRIYGVATFYNLFTLRPPGRYVVRVCKGTACHVNNSEGILVTLKERLGIDEDATTPDGLFTLQTVACMGACSLAPVLAINDRTYGRTTPQSAWGTLVELRAQAVGEAGR
jgi:NADH-quinone oxidoreductase subunit E